MWLWRLFKLQSLNVLIIGEGKVFQLVKNSKFLNKIYVTSSNNDDEFINIKFNTFKELVKKCKSLRIDFVIVEDEKLIAQGIAETLQKNFINCIAINSYWYDLLKTYKTRTNLLAKYDISYPKLLKFPSEFPVYLKTVGYKKQIFTMQDLIKEKKYIDENLPRSIAENTYIEKDLGDKVFNFSSIYDGKNLRYFVENELSDIQNERLQIYFDKFKNLLIDEKANFMGFINSELVWFENDWYNLSFGIDFPKPKIDFLFLLNSALYQKLNEISL